MTINLKLARRSLQEFNFSELFIEELGWSNPLSKKAIATLDGSKAQPIAQLSGVMILQVTSATGEIADAQTRKAIHKEISGLYLENLLIFIDREQTKSLWYWAKRESNKLYYRDHLFTKGQSGDLLLSKLGALAVDFAELEKGDLSVVQVARRLQDSFDVEKVTKKFYKDFQDQHGKFLEYVEGIDNENDRRWYTSVTLNRLMFIYFLQRKYFLDNRDEFYLQHKLQQSKQRGENRYYSEFLEALFFQGFAQPEPERSPAINNLIGKIKYLNGGLFIKHHIENTYPNIQICDRAFEEVLNLFSRYSWNLDDSPSGKDEEINPDVLGYIFEKYINQKAFGAYYTRPEITEYLCDRTINKLICDRIAQSDLSLNELLLNLDANLCDRLLNEILPKLSLLDPACGSGAFLVAAMKTLIQIYTTVASQAKQFIEQKDPQPLTPSPKEREGGQENTSTLTPLSQVSRGAGGEGEYWQISPALHAKMVDIAKELRKKSTPSEAILWQALRNRKLEDRKFRRQQPIGAFVVDFYCGAERLVVEIDGSIHETQKELDLERQTLIESIGVRFIRITSNLVETDLPLALKTISNSFLPPSTHLGEGLGVRADNPEAKQRISNWLTEAQKSSSLDYYIKKRIITDNLYGVDIMEEATEIAKLRLFLALVASAKTIEDLEPLPNIDFNIMAGNSLIGLIRVNAEGFDQISQASKSKGMAVDPTQKDLFNPTILQGNLLQADTYNNYQAILKDKNASIALYKKHAFLKGEQQEVSQDHRLLQLRDHIDKLNRESQAKLNLLLLDEFSSKLGIKYEEAQLTGKPIKRVLNINDINALEPFHWGYHFDEVINNRGGFDAIITNPPWEIFKPQAKEFFAQHSDFVTKNKMDIKAFEKEQAKLLESPEVAIAWLKYQSQYPYVSSYFRSAVDYSNQISVVNGKKAGTDINLYKLFLERCFNLLRPSGECGIVIPSGIYTDLGTKQLREMLFNETTITGLFCFENRKTIFEGVDSRFKFIILTFEKGGKTESFPTRFMRHDVTELANFPNPDDIRLDIPLIHKLSPDSLSIMEFQSDIDVQIAKKMLQYPLLGEKIDGKWNLKLTAEFHMTNDSKLFKTEAAIGRLPLYEGKMIHQFTHQFAKPRYWVDEKEARKSLLGKIEDKGQKIDYQEYRLGFRDIARNTDQRTLICSITPRIFHGNKLPNINPIENGKILIYAIEQVFLCGILNSFMIDWTIRQRVTTTLNFFYIYQLPVPRLQKGDKWFDEIVERAAKLICTTPEFDDLAKEVGLGSHLNGVTNEVQRAKLRAELDGIIAHLYQLTEVEFAHILTTFPIVPDPTKQAALNAYRDVERGL
jgi:very-short-patch-repair endonuclease